MRVAYVAKVGEESLEASAQSSRKGIAVHDHFQCACATERRVSNGMDQDGEEWRSGESTIARFVEAVVGVVVRSEHDHLMARLLQPQRCVHHKPLGTT